ncbi:MAG: RCC1 domain-containing protein, partial [Acidimicrobiia bacterium]
MRARLVLLFLGSALTVSASTAAVSSEPVRASLSVEWKQVSAGAQHSCGVTTSNQLFCWGDDGFGKLGNGAATESQPTPVQVSGNNWASVDAGRDHTCAHKTNGRLFCWGRDNLGQRGDGGVIPGGTAPAPVEVFGNTTDWASVTAGFDHTCARKIGGQLFCWGNDSDGQLGIGSDFPVPATSPAPVEGDATDWSSVSAGRIHTCASKTNGQLFCWGDDSNGQLGNDILFEDANVPVLVLSGGRTWS